MTPETVLEAVRLLEREGYSANTTVHEDGTLMCGACRETHPIDGALVDQVFRFEGMSDPDDEAIVLGMRCPACGPGVCSKISSTRIVTAKAGQ